VNVLPCWELNSGRPARSLLTIVTELSQIQQVTEWILKKRNSFTVVLSKTWHMSR
jgi:hypothetical protein